MLDQSLSTEFSPGTILGMDGSPIPKGDTLQSSATTLPFSFGDPEPVISNMPVDQLLWTFYDDLNDYYVPPISMDGLVMAMRTNSCLESATFLRRNALVNTYKPNAMLSRKTMEAIALDYENTGNAYLRIIRGLFGRPLRLAHLHARVMRVKKDGNFNMLNRTMDPIWFSKEDIIHIKEYGGESSVYGIPCHIGTLQSAMLSEDASLHRRKFFRNGAHMGFVFYVDDEKLSEKKEEELAANLENSKAAGNFRSMLYVNRSKKGQSNTESIKIIPVGEISSKDEFEKIKNISNQEVLIGKRVQPGLMGVIPGGANLGDVTKAMQVFGYLEIDPLQQDFMSEINTSRIPKSGHISFGKFGFEESA